MAYVAWVFVVDGLGFASGMLAVEGVGTSCRATRRPWGVGALAAAASYGGLWRLGLGDDRGTDCAGGGAARNLDPVCGADRLAGFGERMTRGKALAAVVIVAGVMLTRL